MVVTRVRLHQRPPTIGAQNCSGRFAELELPHVLGVEGVGVVLKSRCESFQEGARIAFLLKKFFNDESHGCWQRRLILDEHRAMILAVPAVVGLNQIAACTTSTVAALAFLKFFPPASQIIVTAACGAVGLATMQLGALRGHRMIGLVRGPERAAWIAKELVGCGSIAVVDTDAPGWIRLAFPMSGKGELIAPPDSTDVGGGADGIIDGVGGEVLALALEELLRVRAIVVRYSAVLGEDAARVDAAQHRLHLQVRYGNIEEFMASLDAVRQVEAAFALIGDARYQPKAWHVASWKEVAECMKDQPIWTRHATQVKPGRIGRIILKFD
ncbi:unnamed protein product [Symbiodinium natans]|uniref:Alcohol dehydrogenase-like C-terminal domain-containing protein n=1 Tax=Symbiodinium natans TaxID=878477 RepID=A0A812SYE8_9DINO|nr:unnamed protein product [Symbiodinium natans]